MIEKWEEKNLGFPLSTKTRVVFYGTLLNLKSTLVYYSLKYSMVVHS